jgi:hypothetical protein
MQSDQIQGQNIRPGDELPVFSFLREAKKCGRARSSEAADEQVVGAPDFARGFQAAHRPAGARG